MLCFSQASREQELIVYVSERQKRRGDDFSHSWLRKILKSQGGTGQKKVTSHAAKSQGLLYREGDKTV